MQSPQQIGAASGNGSPASSSLSTPRSARAGDAEAASTDGAGASASAHASPSVLPLIEESAQTTDAGVDTPSAAAAQPADDSSGAGPRPPPSPTPPESPMSPAREISPVSAKILAAEAGKMHNAKSTYKTPAPGLGGGFGAFDYEPPPPPAERAVGALVVPSIAALQDSPRPGSVKELSATFSGPLSLSRTASNASDESFPRPRGAAGRAYSTDGSDSFHDAADAATSSRVNRRSSLGAPPMGEQRPVAESEILDDDDDFGTFEEADEAPVVETSADEGLGAGGDGFGTFEKAPPSATAEPADAAAPAGDDDGFADFEDAASGDDDGFGDFGAAPTAAPISIPAVCGAFSSNSPHLDCLGGP